MGCLEHAAHLSERVLTATRREPDVAHCDERDDERHHEHDNADHVRHAEVRRLSDRTARNGAPEHGDPFDDFALGEHRLELAVRLEIPGERQCIDEPCLDRPRKERETEPEQHRGDRPPPERHRIVPHQEIEQRRDRERDRSEQIRRSPPLRVGDDARRYLEEHRAEGKKSVRGKRFEVAQARIEEKQRVDAPDERRGKRAQEEQGQVRPLNLLRLGVHRRGSLRGIGEELRSMPPSSQRSAFRERGPRAFFKTPASAARLRRKRLGRIRGTSRRTPRALPAPRSGRRGRARSSGRCCFRARPSGES